MYMLILTLPFRSPVNQVYVCWQNLDVFWWGAVLSPSSRPSLPYGSVCRCVLGNVELPHGSSSRSSAACWASLEIQGFGSAAFLFSRWKRALFGTWLWWKVMESWLPTCPLWHWNVFVHEWIQGFIYFMLDTWGLMVLAQPPCRRSWRVGAELDTKLARWHKELLCPLLMGLSHHTSMSSPWSAHGNAMWHGETKASSHAIC